MPERDEETGRFKSTAVTRQRDEAIAEIGESTVYGMVAEGLPMRVIADNLGMDGSDVQAREAVRNWLRKDGDRYEEAKEKSVDALSEKAGQVYGEDTPAATADAKWRNDRSGYYRWLAEMRAGLRDRGGVNVTVDVGTLHLDALRQKGSMAEHGPELEGGELPPDEDEPEAIEAVEGRDYEIEEAESPPGDDGIGKRELGDLPKRG